MKRIDIEFPDELTEGEDPRALVNLAQQAFLVRLYQLGRISSGRAAEVLHISRRAFLDLLADYCVSVFDENADVIAEAGRGR